MKRLEGKSAWVTGAGSGIGRAIAILFAQEGAKVALTGRRTAPLEETARMIGGGAVVVPADLTDDKQVAAALAKVESTIGGPDILVNNAGVNLPKRYLHQLTPEAIRTLVDGNLTAPFMTSVAVLPGMRRRGGGHLVQIASMAGKNISFLSGPGYTAAKHGFVALSQAINQENGIHNIRSCCICPGEVATDILKNRPEPVPAEEIERLLQPEDIAAMALFAVTMPPRANITEMLVTPTYMRLLAPQAKKIAAM
ncbi:SDR family oxidoreductase [Roseomonas alkaliterrae]|uniref:NADP-dependent 3-hydroxy acid dehydrogenase YdfG n=1 Tax=Neoroseomonas alkaliterrae TaxID=1452450 RepID=A0A840XIS8_9PROT|nr:SDR family oxidoreductase [Neoroseomonas alkaliterrae]MBB5688358.1 NADP-dependent 3-hydroxy acid dehydrogenase YdfG [Neoroseomonas alkaliterrae]MBR0676433.1 SDR family oxidoreductase [Neoroseomonas alkaliterrae]